MIDYFKVKALEADTEFLWKVYHFRHDLPKGSSLAELWNAGP
jgi:hypothetical protein